MKDEEFDETKPVIKLLHILSRYSNEQSLAILSIALKVELHQSDDRGLALKVGNYLADTMEALHYKFQFAKEPNNISNVH
jgi:hypothetical protein